MWLSLIWVNTFCPDQFVPKVRVILHTSATTWQNQQSDCAPSEDSDQPGHPPSLIRAFAVRMKKPWFLSYPLSAQRRLWSDWVDAQADLSLHWVVTLCVGFVMSRLTCDKFQRGFREIFLSFQGGLWKMYRIYRNIFHGHQGDFRI